MEETLTRQIKIYCPQHHSVFEVAQSPKIVCEIRAHALSNDFPKSEFWEYCCDCQTFFPSTLEVGGKAREVCLQCERKTIRRFVCSECKMISYDSDEDTKGKIFRLNADTEAIAPSCPGCFRDHSATNSHLHKCEEAHAIILTQRKNCPFCKKEIAPPKKKSATPVKPVTETPKTMLLGSICPSCGAGNDSDSVFCANCGQGLKPPTPKMLQNLPPNMPPIPTQTVNQPAENVKMVANVKSNNRNGCLAVFGILFGVFVLWAVITAIVSSKKTTDYPANYSNYNSNKVDNSSFATNNTSMVNSNRMTYNTNKTNSNLSLPTSFSRDYSGTIAGRNLTMSLTRSGSTLEGTASTSRTDKLYGTIDSSGNFTLRAYENDGSYQSGIYKGRIYANGSIGGTWTNPQGGQSTSFSLTEN